MFASPRGEQLDEFPQLSTTAYDVGFMINGQQPLVDPFGYEEQLRSSVLVREGSQLEGVTEEFSRKGWIWIDDLRSRRRGRRTADGLERARNKGGGGDPCRVGGGEFDSFMSGVASLDNKCLDDEPSKTSESGMSFLLL